MSCVSQNEDTNNIRKGFLCVFTQSFVEQMDWKQVNLWIGKHKTYQTAVKSTKDKVHGVKKVGIESVVV